MIKFYDQSGETYFGQATITRTTSVNGGLSLTGEVFAGDDVLNGLDYGWWLNFDNEKYVITYKKLSDDTNTIVFDAVQQFFWDFAKVALHSQYTGSHEYAFYLNQLFNESGYTYNNDATVPAFEKENWGYKNKLSLFNDIMDQADVEFEVHNETVHIAKQIGSDLTSFVRKGINLSDLTEEMKISDFATYAKGYGAFKDSDDQSKGRLEVEYRSELAKKFGDLETDPIVDERYTVADNLIAELKKQVDATYTVSMTMNIYDLENAGYPNYESPKVGDWILAIDEALNFKRKIRIIKLEEQFDATGKRIGYTATCGDLNIVDQYTNIQSSLDNKVQRIQESVDNVAASANEKNSNYYGAKEPISADDGDLWFDQSNSDPDKWSIKQWANGRWEQLTLNPGEVDAKVSIAKQAADTAIGNANTAVENANDAVAKAGFANDTATQAKSDAASAGQQAKDALTSAGTAITDAQNALTNSSSAMADSTQARKDSAAAKIQATNAATQANQAVTDASTAKADANTAKGQATNALGQANTAIGNAADALNKINGMSVGGRNYLLNSKSFIITPPGTANWDWRINITDDFWSNSNRLKSNNIRVSFTLTAQKALTADFNSRVYFWSPPYPSQPFSYPAGTTAPQKYELVFNITDSAFKTDNCFIRFQAKDTSANPFILENAKLEIGTTFTDWSPAPEDVQQQFTEINGELANKVSQTTYNTLAGTVDTVNTLAKQNQSTISTLATKTSVDTVNHTATTAQTLAQQNANELLNKANSTTVNTLTQRVTTAESTLKQTATTAQLALTQKDIDDINDTVTTQGLDITAMADGLKLKADSSTVSSLDGRVTNLSGQLDVQADKIAATVTANDVTGMLSNYATQSWSEGKISATKNEISASVETVNQRVNNLSFSGRNLLPGTNQGLTNWTFGAGAGGSHEKYAFDVPNGQGMTMTTTVAYTNWFWLGYKLNYTVLKQNTDYVLSFWAKSTDIDRTITARFANGGVANLAAYFGATTLKSGVATKVVLKATTTDVKFTDQYLHLYSFAMLGGIDIWDLQLVEGTSALDDWSPAPEDMATVDWTKSQLDITGKKITAGITTVTNTLNNNIASATANMATTTWTNTQIDAAKTAINLSVEQSITTSENALNSNIDNATKDMATQTWTQGQIKTTADAINLSVSKVQTDLGGTKTQFAELAVKVDGIQTTVSGKADQSQVTQLANQISLKADTTALNELKGTVDKQGSEITLNTNSIKLKADQSSVNTLKGTVDKQGSAIDVNTKAIALKANQSTVDTLTGRVSTAEGKITVQADQIAQTVSKTELTTKLNDYATQTWTQSQIKSTADSINLNVSKVQTNLDNLKIGGTNLIQNSGFENAEAKDFERIKASASYPTPFGEYMARIHFSNGAVNTDFNKYWTLPAPITIEANTEYTMSYYYSAAGSAVGQASDFAYNGDAVIMGLMMAHESHDNSGGQGVWKRFVRTFKLANETTITRLRIGFVTNSGNTGWKVVDNFQLEKGNKVSDHSPSPSDYASDVEFSNLEVKVNGVQTTVANKADQSQVTQLAGQITSVVGDVSANSSQITQMKADINLRVKVGDVINQINISPEGILIDGQKVHITGQTSIDNAVIKDAMIANVTADKITAGTLNAANVNVINLNANNITTGTIKGANLSMNLNTGEVLFQKGSIKSTNGNLNIHIDDGSMSLTNSQGEGAYFIDGKIAMTKNDIWANGAIHYGQLTFGNNIFGNALGSVSGVQLEGAGGVIVGNKEFNPLTLFGPGKTAPSGGGFAANNSFATLSSKGWASIEGGTLYATAAFSTSNPSIVAGVSGKYSAPGAWMPTSDKGPASFVKGKMVGLYAEDGGFSMDHGTIADLAAAVDGRSGYILSAATYARTYASGAQMTITESGVFGRISSASKYKLAIGEISTLNDEAHQFLSVKPKQWFDKSESEALADTMTTGNTDYIDDAKALPHTGFIAEDLYTAGLDSYVLRGSDGSIESIQYDRLPVLHHELIRELFNRLDAAELEIYKLKQEANNAS